MGKTVIDGGSLWRVLWLATMVGLFGYLGVAVKFAWHAWTTGW